MGQSKISLKELASVKIMIPESIDEYLNRFRLLDARCFTQVPEYELVEMVDGSLDYSIIKKLHTHYLRDMAQLADRVQQVERLKAEKARSNKFHRKERVAYIGREDYSSDMSDECVGEGEINVSELNLGPLYKCKLLKPSNDKKTCRTGKK